MTPDQKHLVRESWQQVVPTAEAAAELFYHRLFEIDPTTPALFRAADMFAQRSKLLRTLGFAISSLDNLELLMTTVENLGRRHAGYGVTEAHYGSVGSALLWALEQRLGRAWTPDVASARREVYALLSGIMRSAAASVRKARDRRFVDQPHR